MMTNFLKSFKIVAMVVLLVTMLFACRKKYPYFFPDGTPGHGSDSSSITVDTAMSNIDYSKYPQARVFPGLVGDKVPRIEDTAITLDLDYRYIGQSLRVSVPPQPQFSVGLYAPPGELVKIVVPEGMHNLSIQVGGWTDNLGGKLNPKRDPLIFSRQKLEPGDNFVRNLYGGTIYILSPRPVEDPVTLRFTGAVKSPDFILDETDPTEWWKNLKKYDVPWLELRSPHYIALVPREKFLTQGLDDPTKAVQFWEDAVKHDYYEWMGLVKNADNPVDEMPELPFRAVLDVDITVGYGHSGFPVMWIDDYYWFNSVASYDAIRRLDAWGSFHEFGHNMQQGSTWSISNLGETTNNLFIMHAAYRMNKIYKANGEDTVSYQSLHNMKDIWETGLEFASTSGGNFVTDVDDAFEAILPFMQIYMKAKPYSGSQWTNGWDFMTVLYRKARRAKRLSANDQDRMDFIYEALCEFTHQNWLPWFSHWGMRISKVSKEVIEDKNYPGLDKTIWTYNPVEDTGGNRPYIFDPYSQGNWSVVDFSSQEETGEGAGNGKVLNAIDGNINTFWHSQWQGASPNPPHWFIIDLGSELNVDGFYFYQRQGNANVRIKKLTIEVTNDDPEDPNSNWIDLGEFNLDPGDTNKQTRMLSNTEYFRYFRVTVASKDDINGNTACALAEINIIKP